MLEKKLLDLYIFDGDGGGAAGAGDAGGAEGADGSEGGTPLDRILYGKQPEETPVKAQAPDPAEAANDDSAAQDPDVAKSDKPRDAKQRIADFESLIKGEYKDLYDARVQGLIDKRFKQAKQAETQSAKIAPVLELIASKYGVDANDADALVKAIESDDSYFEDEAIEQGLSIEQLKEMKRLRRESAELRRITDERQRVEHAERIFQGWQEQAHATQQVYSGFNLQSECQHPETGERFLGLLKSGVDVRTAYEVIHKDELIGGAMQFTAQQVQQKTLNDIRTRGMRPAENGAGGGAGVLVKTDPNKLTKADRDEIARRVMRGERISF